MLSRLGKILIKISIWLQIKCFLQKFRFSDFQVNEIDTEGNVVKLTDTSLPTLPKTGRKKNHRNDKEPFIFSSFFF